MTNKQVYYDDVEVGMEVPCIVKPITLPIMMRWCAACEIWRRDHWDRDYSIHHDNLPDAVLSSGLKQAFLYQMLQDWVGETGWVWKMTHRDRGMVHPGEILTGWGKVTNKYVKDGLGYVELQIGMSRRDGTNTVPGSAMVVLPLRGGKPVPYPFKP